ncbi:hypothetical protein C8A05DRAFT_36751 [Staphylotrichum tortipilum]|uniref:Uncharacterized protein n=1 Tax=Staphylotrichum tortipilum TaxID=2831512 RepID=A0AAN6RR15_9PEZI|nr:hypothetical protein C8A05DRAFT_36751 [Staphylotrichum longicolle]
MAPWARLFWFLYTRFEDQIVASILRSPRFHHGVRRIHRTVEDLRHGRNPNEPLRQGEATAEPKVEGHGFFKYFIDELRNQARGKPTEPPPGPPKK